MSTSALVLFSGGQDSTISLAWALREYNEVHTIGFLYGQRHSVEIECRKKIIEKIKKYFPKWSSKIKSDNVLDLSFFNEFSKNALTSKSAIKMMSNGLPSTFVPGRNLIFLSIATSYALSNKINDLIMGVCETDYSGYPDCRNEFVKSMNNSINLASDKSLNIVTPLMFLDKSESWHLAYKLGNDKLIDIIIDDTHSCYRGIRNNKYEWGYGCNNCFACELRANGWLKYNELLRK